MRVFEFIQDTVQDLIEEFEEDDPLYGTLTRTIMEDRIPAADGSGTYPVTAVEEIRLGDVVQTRKPHPCGSSEFVALRVGMDFRIRCTKCGREVMVPRAKIERNIKKIVRDSKQ